MADVADFDINHPQALGAVRALYQVTDNIAGTGRSRDKGDSPRGSGGFIGANPGPGILVGGQQVATVDHDDVIFHQPVIGGGIIAADVEHQ